MNFTRATYHFAAVPDVCQAYTLYIHTDGYPTGAAGWLHTMLLDQGASHARAFQQAHQERAYVSKDPSGDDTTSFRYLIDEFAIVAQERLKAGVDEWKTVFTGPLLDFISESCNSPLLHATGRRAEGGINFQTLEMLETHFAEAQRTSIRHEALTPGGDAKSLALVAHLRGHILTALRAESAAGRNPFN